MNARSTVPQKVIVFGGLALIAARLAIGSAFPPPAAASNGVTGATETCVMTHYAVGVPCFVAP